MRWKSSINENYSYDARAPETGIYFSSLAFTQYAGDKIYEARHLVRDR